MILKYLLLFILQILLKALSHFLIDPLSKRLALNDGFLGLPFKLTLHFFVYLLLELLDVLGL